MFGDIVLCGLKAMCIDVCTRAQCALISQKKLNLDHIFVQLVDVRDEDQGVEVGEWWLYIDNSPAGYWPQRLLSPGQLQHGLANRLQWGGEVYHLADTSIVKMGNGRYGEDADGVVPLGDTNTPAYHAYLRYLEPGDAQSWFKDQLMTS